jgi:hypothetical protein
MFRSQHGDSYYKLSRSGNGGTHMGVTQFCQHELRARRLLPWRAETFPLGMVVYFSLRYII